MTRNLALTAVAALLLTSCAKRPDAISPVSIPVQAYAHRNCAALQREHASELANLASLSDQQDRAATGDAVGVFLFGLPVSSAVGGDQEGNVAVSKGKVLAIESAMVDVECPRLNH
jgi:hypothetical protein